MSDWSKSERVQGGNNVQVVRMNDTSVAIVFTTKTKGDADVLFDRTVKGLKRGEFRMRLRGKVTGVTER